MTANNRRDDWWKQAVVYQVYPRSFKDMNGDGLGDIAGVTNRIPYLRELGVDAIWMSPFYPSELADGGYDVIDYRNIDPRLGTLDDFDVLVAAAHDAGIKIIIDIVPNHTSDKHRWFVEALASEPGSPARDRYIFREGRGENGELPPNDWQSVFGGPAWERTEDGQWYLHMFAKQQPDLNWKNQDVHDEFAKTLRFWSDRGVDGFRIDVAHGLAKDLDSQPLDQMDPDLIQHPDSADGLNPLWDRPEVHDIYREWNAIFNEYNPPRFAVGEAWVVPEHQHLYARKDELGQVFNFEFSKAQWFAGDFRRAIEEGLASAEEADSTTTWVMSNHDVPRHASRYGLPQIPEENGYHVLPNDWLLRDGESYIENRELGARRARAAIMMELGLPGSVYVYQGEELGLPEVATIPWDRLEDPTAFNTFRSASSKGRDGCRVPLPWSAQDEPSAASYDLRFGTGASFGFSEPAEDGTRHDPHLPQPLWFRNFCADVESNDTNSMLNLYRRTIAYRQSLLTSTGDTSLTWYSANDFDPTTTIAYTRPLDDINGDRFACITNFGDAPVELPDGEILLKSGELDGYSLPKDTCVWMRV